MRFLFTVDENWRVTITCPEKGDGWQCPPRYMRKIVVDATRAFPAPPQEELRMHSCPLCCGDNPSLMQQTYEGISLKRQSTRMKEFGHYLFESLIGETNWKSIKDAAEEAHAPLIELALSWSSSEKFLPRFNWEMMRSADNFLVAGSGKANVAITRVVADSTCTIRQMPLPPRILFVIGTTITDPIIKPGAEYLSLLRQIKARGAGHIYSRVIDLASPQRMKKVMESFKPDVVHFICHGGIDRATGRGFLKLQKDDQESDERRFGSQLAEFLRMEDGSYPPVVVLSACDSATTSPMPTILNGNNNGTVIGNDQTAKPVISGRLLGAHETSSLAAELIYGGIPIVIGMAGKVSDIACRLFTRQLGTALVEGKALITATAEARRATFAQNIAPDSSVDWAFLAIFMAKSVDAGYAPVRPQEVDPFQQIEQWITNYHLEEAPVFCGRNEFFQAYYDFFNPDSRLVFTINVKDSVEYDGKTEQLGKTRLLKELAMQALRDGHIPCLVDASNTSTIPTNTEELGECIRTAIIKVREILLLDVPDSQLDLLLSSPFEELLVNPGLDRYIKAELKTKQRTTDRAIYLAVQKDLIQLANDARKYVPLLAHGRVLVLLDAVELYDKAIGPLFTQFLTKSGLGTANEPIPVVLAFSSYGPSLEKFKEHIGESRKNSLWLKDIRLDRFADDGEDMLAYTTMLLYPAVAGSRVPLVIEESEAAMNYCQGDVREVLGRIPSIFASQRFDKMAHLALQRNMLKEADDEHIMRMLQLANEQ